MSKTFESEILKLKNTKASLKEALIGKGSFINEGDSFSSYVTKLDNIETKLENYQGIYSITPNKDTQIVLNTQEKTLINNITINPVTSVVDRNICSENIKDGISILGIKGTYKNIVGTVEKPVGGVKLKDSFWTGDLPATKEDILEYTIVGPDTGAGSLRLVTASMGDVIQRLHPGIPFRFYANNTRDSQYPSFTNTLCTVVDIDHWQNDISYLPDIDNMFRGCTLLSSLSMLPGGSYSQSMKDTFAGCISLKSLKLGSPFGASINLMKINLVNCPLDHDSLIDNSRSLLNSLAVRDNNPELKLRKDCLTQDEIEMFKQKGWNITLGVTINTIDSTHDGHSTEEYQWDATKKFTYKDLISIPGIVQKIVPNSRELFIQEITPKENFMEVHPLTNGQDLDIIILNDIDIRYTIEAIEVV